MSCRSGTENALPVFGESDFFRHVHPMDSGPRLDEGPVKKVAIVGHEDVRADLQNVVEPSLEIASKYLL